VALTPLEWLACIAVASTVLWPIELLKLLDGLRRSRAHSMRSLPT